MEQSEVLHFVVEALEGRCLKSRIAESGKKSLKGFARSSEVRWDAS
jgi:hypothetical protein